MAAICKQWARPVRRACSLLHILTGKCAPIEECKFCDHLKSRLQVTCIVWEMGKCIFEPLQNSSSFPP